MVPIGELLVRRGVLRQAHLERVLDAERQEGERLGQVCVRLGLAEAGQVAEALAVQMDVPHRALRGAAPAPEVLARMPATVAHHYGCMPLAVRDGVFEVAVADPLDLRRLDDLKTLLDCPVRPVLAEEDEIRRAQRDAYGIGADTAGRLEGAAVAEKDSEDIEGGDADASVARLVNQILADAARARATDVHLEPGDGAVGLRYRIDGVLHERRVPSDMKRLLPAVVSRVKILARLNIAEKRLPQDGRFSAHGEAGEFDVRVSVLPSAHGEAVNLRFLSQRHTRRDLEGIGLLEDDCRLLERVVAQPHGVLLATGPTGSGKTTTLYACLQRIRGLERKILTIEDPVEYRLGGVVQMQVQPKIGLDFAGGLRAMLRHDPDVMMVGEIRDPETAEAAVRAALTGHFVFSTLHTNDAPGAVPRLLNMGVEPYLLSASLEAVVSQRLVRLVCPECKTRTSPPPGPARRWKLDGPVYEGAGCEACESTGYRGQTGIYEVFAVDEGARELIDARAPAGRLRRHALEGGMRRLADDGMEKVRLGWTTVEEVLRVTRQEE